ncbi:unnamed protein product, partial [Lymnaea stagnalis]
ASGKEVRILAEIVDVTVTGSAYELSIKDLTGRVATLRLLKCVEERYIRVNRLGHPIALTDYLLPGNFVYLMSPFWIQRSGQKIIEPETIGEVSFLLGHKKIF